MHAPQRPLIVIEAGRAQRGYLRDVWRLRHLIWMFSWREIVLRYKQTLAGVLWVLIRPLVTMTIFALVFGRFLKIPSNDVPYPLLVLSGLIPWQFAAYSFANASDSLFTHVGVISKVYFPRIIAPMSAFLVNAIDLVVAIGLLAIFMFVYGLVPDLRVLALPVFILAVMPATAGLGLWFAAVSAKYRDFRNVTPFIVLLSLYASPVAFTSGLVPHELKFWYWLNPLVFGIEGVRWALFRGNAELYWPGILISFSISAALLVSGFLYFRRVEQSIVDSI